MAADAVLTLPAPARLVSDLHLHERAPAVTRRFEAFLDDCRAQRIAALCILGDLFEYWIGDDHLADPLAARVAAQLRLLAGEGTALYFMAGNRDFLIGERFADAARLTRLADPTRIACGPVAALLMHGDSLCTDDTAYQDFRARVRDPQWQTDFLALPLPERLAIASNMRMKSREAQEGKSDAIMDVNANAVRAALSDAGTTLLIHGHTHRPGMQRISLDGVEAQRWVLSDWTETRGDAIQIDAAGVRRLDVAAMPAAPD